MIELLIKKRYNVRCDQFRDTNEQAHPAGHGASDSVHGMAECDGRMGLCMPAQAPTGFKRKFNTNILQFRLGLGNVCHAKGQCAKRSLNYTTKLNNTNVSANIGLGPIGSAIVGTVMSTQLWLHIN